MKRAMLRTILACVTRFSHVMAWSATYLVDPKRAAEAVILAPPSERAIRYRHLAGQCLEDAQKADRESHRSILADLATLWNQLAEQVEHYDARANDTPAETTSAVQLDNADEPPALAEWLANLLAAPRHRDGVLQNLDEKFRKHLAAGMSFRRAKRLYWSDALSFVFPRIWRAFKKLSLLGLVAKAFSGH